MRLPHVAVVSRLGRFLPRLLLLFALLALAPAFAGLADPARPPVDFLSYRRAADDLERGGSPYQSPEEARAIWRQFHAAEADLLAAAARGEGAAALRALTAGAPRPGPYLYPPTLALLVAELGLSAHHFAGLILLSILGFGWLWIGQARAGALGAVLVVASWDVLASWSGGNVELVLLFAALAAGWLMGGRGALAAGPLVAFVLLVKPFYALLFVAFTALQLVGDPSRRRATLRRAAAAGAAALLVGLVEVARWGDRLRAEAVGYLAGALDRQWLVLPVAEQTPMSAWNRTPLQGLVSAGLPLAAAVAAAAVLWLFAAGATLRLVRGARPAFPALFGLALVLLYWGRPVGWTLPYLEAVVVGVAWPALGRRGRAALLAAAATLMASHWWALALTLRGEGLPLLTLQRADLPWETWLVLPAAWSVLLWSTRAAAAGAAAERPSESGRQPNTPPVP